MLTMDMLKTGDILVMEDGYEFHSGMLLKDTGIGHVIRWGIEDKSGVCYGTGNTSAALKKVVKVVRTKYLTDFCEFEVESNGSVVWERKEPVKELTVAEIEELLGYKVKVVADEED